MTGPETPPALRGTYYPNHSIERCPNYHRCCRCLKCDQYNRHNATCVDCERYSGRMPCNCTDEQQNAIVQIELVVNRPMFHPNQQPSKVVESQLCFDTAFNPKGKKLAEALCG